jgi:type I restriction enzyme S subunit
MRRGDLVIHAMDAFAGAIGVSDSDGKGTPVYSVCAPRAELNVHYYANIVREMARSQWIAALAKGIRERSTDFRYEAFANEWLPFPPIDEQEAIALFIQLVDSKTKRLIRAKRRMIELLNEQKQAIIRQTVKCGINSGVLLKHTGISWLGDIPEHWAVWQIGHFAQVGNGSTPSRGKASYWANEGFPWLNSGTVNEGVIKVASQFVTPVALKECHLPLVPPGSILMAITGQGKTRGTSAILEIEATINQHIAFITPQNKLVSADYLHAQLTAAYPTLRLISSASGSTKGALTCGDIKHFNVAVPPLAEQKDIVNAVRLETSQVDVAVERAHKEIDVLREYRTRLIADVVTGRLDVRGVELPELENAEEIEPLSDVADEELEDSEELVAADGGADAD